MIHGLGQRNSEIAIATLRKPSVLDDLADRYPRTQLLVLPHPSKTAFLLLFLLHECDTFSNPLRELEPGSGAHTEQHIGLGGDDLRRKSEELGAISDDTFESKSERTVVMTGRPASGGTYSFLKLQAIAFFIDY
ncbi:hypothetical protein BDR03DRAFT_986273 [Suillus americanus]|nr:hypothetical protein BDR03DRAFT_986273 [Suillus americanus]